jgi:hypothetical protein
MTDTPQVGIVLTDVDGTLVDNDHHPILASADVIRRVAEQVPFCLVSARSPEGLYPIQRQLGFAHEAPGAGLVPGSKIWHFYSLGRLRRPGLRERMVSEKYVPSRNARVSAPYRDLRTAEQLWLQGFYSHVQGREI